MGEETQEWQRLVRGGPDVNQIQSQPKRPNHLTLTRVVEDQRELFKTRIEENNKEDSPLQGQRKAEQRRTVLRRDVRGEKLIP